MSQEERRKMIVNAVLPLIVEHGTAVTTAQIARAAGIGEGTIFRAFKDKDELLQACVTQALRPDGVRELIAEIPLDLPLPDRLREAAGALEAHLARMGALVAALAASGTPRRQERPRSVDRRESFRAIREAVAALFEPESDKLRLPADQLGGIFVSLLLNRARDEDKPELTALVDVFLHGAVAA
ncbi:TetR/AcrR family transcriptional regulator [Amycolatopsis cynarae]|uniref:TetR/AcrR family transcriptional regulator n=1 Tax=Amycolatopsis cynarae TaxID=2995223 RepID=A0ABY7BF78_9PSEU|nr:TetR/AcrR family transcriptional regulator [Amycolatopsis sp. HUAS 11-8]WAL69922.1 TetR/AcrR family transcriptional regulator [Amycolatopsis sp. HUAS 11-8]